MATLFLAWQAAHPIQEGRLASRGWYPIFWRHVNADSQVPAPPNQRLLVELSGRFAADYRPMSGQDFQPLVSADVALH